jgi:short-subunit dehydrogenase
VTSKRQVFTRSLALAGVAGAAALLLVRRRREAGEAATLNGKVALITGGSRGLGFAIATELASLGVRLALTSRHQDELEAAKARLVSQYGVVPANVFVMPCDVSIADEAAAFVSAATDFYGHIDIVINNAGVILVGPLQSQTLESFHEAMNINFFGAVNTTLAVLPQMLGQGRGSIVNVSSIGGKVAFPHLLPYAASKFALLGWSQGLRAELTSKGIHVTTVVPGIMRTGSHIQARFSGDSEAEYRWFASSAIFAGTASNATSAAKKIVRALLRKYAEVSIGLQAIGAARLSNIAPELTARLLTIAADLLPAAPSLPNGNNFRDPDRSIAGKAYRGSLFKWLERSGDRAAERYNQHS